MSRTTIPVERETKERLAEEKRDDETWDDLLRRLSTDEPIEFDGLAEKGWREFDAPSEEDGMEFGAWSEETAERAMERLRESRGRG
ncbi:MAG: hypothetical protein ABEI75_05215 [Halobaculum sp.]